jgi:hypothetical protein
MSSHCFSISSFKSWGSGMAAPLLALCRVVVWCGDHGAGLVVGHEVLRTYLHMIAASSPIIPFPPKLHNIEVLSYPSLSSTPCILVSRTSLIDVRSPIGSGLRNVATGLPTPHQSLLVVEHSKSGQTALQQFVWIILCRTLGWWPCPHWQPLLPLGAFPVEAAAHTPLLLRWMCVWNRCLPGLWVVLLWLELESRLEEGWIGET